MNRKKVSALILLTFLLAALLAVPALATAGGAAPAPDEPTVIAALDDSGKVSGKAIACGIAIGLAAAGGAIGMGLAVGKSTSSIARQPEATGNIRSTLMLGLVFIETAIIYALLVVILVIFVL